MILDDDPTTTPDPQEDPSGWPIVSPGDIVVAEWDWDLAYMGVYLRLEICSRSPYLVREAVLRIDGKGQGSDRVVASRWAKVGPLLPGVRVREEVGISAQGGIGGVSFTSVRASAAVDRVARCRAWLRFMFMMSVPSGDLDRDLNPPGRSGAMPPTARPACQALRLPQWQR